MPTPSLSDCIRKGDNLEIIRLLAATGVVFGHSFALAMRGNSGVTEPTSVVLPGTYSGSLAVEAFFFISGFLITNSLMSKSNQSLLQFLRARAVRVLPAFIVMLLITTFLMAPLASNSNLLSYWQDPATYRYFFSMLSLELFLNLETIWTIPGTFEGHQSAALNGSLWSLFYEVKLYLISGLGVLVGAYKWPQLGSALCFFGLLLTLSQGANQTSNSFVMNAVFMYALGAIVCCHATRLTVSIFPLLIASALVYFFRHTSAGLLLYSLWIASAVIYFAYADNIVKIKLPGDYSYGLFLWSYPIQQLLAWYWPTLGPYRFFLVSLALSFFFATLSWHLVEKPALQWNKRRLASATS
jgi:peptidoglycan/LPS O-acetylase OafA/YrhL